MILATFLDLISSRYQGPGIIDQGSGIREQGTENRDQGEGIPKRSLASKIVNEVGNASNKQNGPHTKKSIF